MWHFRVSNDDCLISFIRCKMTLISSTKIIVSASSIFISKNSIAIYYELFSARNKALTNNHYMIKS